jgi:hypothetical protein
VVNIADRAIKADPKRRSAEWLQALGWKNQGFSDWSHPNQLQEVVQLFPDGWIHRSWDKIVGTGDTLDELKAHLAAAGLGESYLPKQSHYATYFKAKLALWKAHMADELDDRLREYNQNLRNTLPATEPGDEVFLYKALEQLHPGATDLTLLPKDEQQNVRTLAQEIKRTTAL